MSKRTRTASGTGDVNPQYLTYNTGTATGVDVYTVNRVNLPVARIGGSKTKAVVMEMLAVDWYTNLADQGDGASSHWAYFTTNTTRADGNTSTLASSQADASDALTLAMAFRTRGFATQGGWQGNQPHHIDLTDQEGNGVLVATDQIFIVAGAVSNTVAGEATAKVLYRLKEVGIQEYVGIVQSQQG